MNDAGEDELEEYLREQMRDPGFRAAYEAAERRAASRWDPAEIAVRHMQQVTRFLCAVDDSPWYWAPVAVIVVAALLALLAA